MKKKRVLSLRITAMMLAAVVLLLVGAFILLPDRAFSPAENRNLQQLPQPSLHALVSERFESRFDDYVADQFPLRDRWIAVKAVCDRLFGRTEANGIFLGRDGYLLRGFAAPDAESEAATLDALRGFCLRHASLGLYVMIAPSAMTVCADKLPAFAPCGDEGGYMDRLRDGLADTPAEWIELRDVLRSDRQLYYRTDHHWTTDAAALAYQAFADAARLNGGAFERRILTDAFSGTLTASSGFRVDETDVIAAYLPEKAVNYVVNYVDEGVRRASVYHPENLAARDKYTVFLNGNHPRVDIETATENKRRLLLIKDSYANCFAPFLIQDFQKIVIVDPRHYTDDVEALIGAERITDILFLYNAQTLAADVALRADISA